MLTFNINCHTIHKKWNKKNWVKKKDDSGGTYTNADIKFKSTMLKSM